MNWPREASPCALWRGLGWTLKPSSRSVNYLNEVSSADQSQTFTSRLAPPHHTRGCRPFRESTRCDPVHLLFLELTRPFQNIVADRRYLASDEPFTLCKVFMEFSDEPSCLMQGNEVVASGARRLVTQHDHTSV